MIKKILFILVYTAGASAAFALPEKGSSENGILRVTSVSETKLKNNYIVYSRYSPVNSSGEYLLVHGEDSQSCVVVRLSDLAVIAEVGDAFERIGEKNEIRWDYSGDHPKRIYFVKGSRLMQMNFDMPIASTVHDFKAEFPGVFRVYNDVEGDSSNDSRYWAFQIRYPYNGSKFPLRAIVTYDKQADAVMGVMDYAKYKAYGGKLKTLPIPNMVEISPLGSKVIYHLSGRWAGWGEKDIGTVFDGPHAWDLDFTNPVKVSVAETHSGWAVAGGREYFVSQNNINDWIEAVDIATGEVTQLMEHGLIGWGGMHFSKSYDSRVLVSTYDPDNTNPYENACFFLDVVTKEVTGLNKMQNRFSGDYREEAPAAVGLDGNVYWSADWNGELPHHEVFQLKQ